MEALTLLCEIESRGATVACEGAALRVLPARVLDDSLRADIRSLKPEIIELLKARESRNNAEISQPRVLSAWEVFREKVESARRPDGLIQMSAEICEAWRAAELEAGHALTLRGERR